MSEHIVGAKSYVIVWAALLCLTVLTAGLSMIDLDWHGVPFNTVFAVAIACGKASLIALIFMHMKYAERVTQVAGVAALLWLAIMFVLTASDFLTRYFGTFPAQ